MVTKLTSRFISQFAAMVCALLLLASCDATIHFYPEPPKSRAHIRLNVDWSNYGKETPTGMTVVCHHSETGEKYQTVDNNIDYITPVLTEGRHWATVFNYTAGEFNNIRLRGLESAETAEAYLPVSDIPNWYKSRVVDSYLAAEPEWFATDTIMTDRVEAFPTAQGSDTIVIGTLYPRNIIYTLHVIIHTENVNNLSAARGAITGMASGRRLAADAPNDNSTTVTHLLESDIWSRSRAGESTSGVILADLRCFGLPSNHLGEPEENILEFQALLADGKTVRKYKIPVGHLIKERVRPEGQRGDNLDLYLEVTLDPSLPPGSGGWGFDVWVEDWDEEEDVEIPI